MSPKPISKPVIVTPKPVAPKPIVTPKPVELKVAKPVEIKVAPTKPKIMVEQLPIGATFSINGKPYTLVATSNVATVTLENGKKGNISLRCEID